MTDGISATEDLGPLSQQERGDVRRHRALSERVRAECEQHPELSAAWSRAYSQWLGARGRCAVAYRAHRLAMERHWSTEHVAHLGDEARAMAWAAAAAWDRWLEADEALRDATMGTRSAA